MTDLREPARDKTITIPTDQLVKCVLPMYAVSRSAEWHAIGTGFVIGRLDECSAVLVTAAHNLRGLESLVRRRPKSHGTTLDEFTSRVEKTWSDLGVELVFLLRGSEGTVVATVVGDAQLLEHDLAIVRVTIPPDSRTRFDMALPISLVPRLGSTTHVAAVGYPGLTAASTQDWERGAFLATAKFMLTSRDGRVLENAVPTHGLHRGRAGVMVDIPFDGGMSGGPLIELCGSTPVARAVVSADVSESPATGVVGSGVQAFASLLLPIAGLRLCGINLTFLDGSQLDDPSILDLIMKGVIKHHGDVPETLRIIEEIDGRVTVTCSVTVTATSKPADEHR